MSSQTIKKKNPLSAITTSVIERRKPLNSDPRAPRDTRP